MALNLDIRSFLEKVWIPSLGVDLSLRGSRQKIQQLAGQMSEPRHGTPTTAEWLSPIRGNLDLGSKSFNIRCSMFTQVGRVFTLTAESELINHAANTSMILKDLGWNVLHELHEPRLCIYIYIYICIYTYTHTYIYICKCFFTHVNSSGGVQQRGALPKSPSRSARSHAPAQPRKVVEESIHRSTPAPGDLRSNRLQVANPKHARAYTTWGGILWSARDKLQGLIRV